MEAQTKKNTKKKKKHVKNNDTTKKTRVKTHNNTNMTKMITMRWRRIADGIYEEDAEDNDSAEEAGDEGYA